MPPTTPVLLAAAVLLGALTPLRARAQASPYIPVDDPRLPLLEHLIARGDVADPTPMVRPFRRADAVRALEAADTGGPSASLIRALRTELDDGPATQRWQASGRAGGQVYSHVRRDVLHPLGPGRQGRLEIRANAGVHHVVNAAHEAGRTVNRFEGRLQATLGLGRRGVLP